METDSKHNFLRGLYAEGQKQFKTFLTENQMWGDIDYLISMTGNTQATQGEELYSEEDLYSGKPNFAWGCSDDLLIWELHDDVNLRMSSGESSRYGKYDGRYLTLSCFNFNNKSTVAINCSPINTPNMFTGRFMHDYLLNLNMQGVYPTDFKFIMPLYEHNYINKQFADILDPMKYIEADKKFMKKFSDYYLYGKPHTYLECFEDMPLAGILAMYGFFPYTNEYVSEDLNLGRGKSNVISFRNTNITGCPHCPFVQCRVQNAYTNQDLFSILRDTQIGAPVNMISNRHTTFEAPKPTDAKARNSLIANTGEIITSTCFITRGKHPEKHLHTYTGYEPSTIN